jgi:hypothetical protein
VSQLSLFGESATPDIWYDIARLVIYTFTPPGRGKSPEANGHEGPKDTPRNGPPDHENPVIVSSHRPPWTPKERGGFRVTVSLRMRHPTGATTARCSPEYGCHRAGRLPPLPWSPSSRAGRVPPRKLPSDGRGGWLAALPTGSSRSRNGGEARSTEDRTVDSSHCRPQVIPGGGRPPPHGRRSPHGASRGRQWIPGDGTPRGSSGRDRRGPRPLGNRPHPPGGDHDLHRADRRTDPAPGRGGAPGPRSKSPPMDRSSGIGGGLAPASCYRGSPRPLRARGGSLGLLPARSPSGRLCL